MKNPFIKKTIGLTTIIAVGLLIVLYPTPKVLAVNESDGGIGNRQNLDQQQTDREGQELARLQKDDEKLCKAQSGSYDSGAGTQASAVPNPDPSNGETQSYGQPAGNEQTTRDSLAAEGVSINNANGCGGLTYQQYTAQTGGHCTDVAGLPQHSIDRLGEINREIGGGLIVTGGTESGHSRSGGNRAHAPGNNVVDLDDSPSMNSYVSRHSVESWSGGSLGTYHRLDNGDIFLRESDHWHARLSGTTGAKQAALRNIGKFFGQATKQIRKLITHNFLAQKVYAQNLNLSRIINLAGADYDLDQISPEQLNSVVVNLSPEQIRTSFTQMSANNLQEVVGTLQFDGVNTVFANLDQNSLNTIIPSLGSRGMNQIVGNLAYESVDNIVGNLGSGQLNTMLNGLNTNNLNTLLGSVYNNGDIFNSVLGNISNDTLNNVLGQLGNGAVNNMFGNLNSNILNSVMGNLGMDSLNSIFGQLGGSALNQVLGGLNGNLSQTVFSVLGDGALNNIMQNGLPNIVDRVMSGLPTNLLEDIFNGLSLSSAFDSIRQALSNLPGLSGILDNIPILGPLLEGGDLTQAATELVTTATGVAGLYVPVVEQNGQLMNLAKSTDKTTKEIKELNVQICTHLRALHRIQARMELKNTEDANVMRVRSTEIEKYRQALFGDNGLIKNGYSSLDSEGNPQQGPLFITNNKQYWEVNGQEGEDVAKDAINGSSNLYKDEFLSYWGSENPLSLNSDISDGDFTNLGVRPGSESQAPLVKDDSFLSLKRIPFVSSLIKPFRKLAYVITGDKAWAAEEVTSTNEVSSQNYWSSWLKLIEPKNNALGSMAIAMDKVSLERNRAVSAAREEAAQGQGFLPVRKCLEKSSDGKTCLTWGTVQPGIIIKEATAAAANARLAQYQNAQNMGELAQGNEPNVTELISNKPAEGGGGAVGPGMTSPDQISQSTAAMTSAPNTNQPNQGETGGTGSGNDEADNAFGQSGLGDLLNNLFNNSDSPNISGNSDVQAIINTLKQTLSFLWNLLKPMVITGSKAKDNGEDLLYWYSPNASDCSTSNDWLDDKSASGVALSSGQSLGGAEGSLRIKATTTYAYKLKCTNNNGSSKEKTIEINK